MRNPSKQTLKHLKKNYSILYTYLLERLHRLKGNKITKRDKQNLYRQFVGAINHYKWDKYKLFRTYVDDIIEYQITNDRKLFCKVIKKGSFIHWKDFINDKPVIATGFVLSVPDYPNSVLFTVKWTQNPKGKDKPYFLTASDPSVKLLFI